MLKVSAQLWTYFTQVPPHRDHTVVVERSEQVLRKLEVSLTELCTERSSPLFLLRDNLHTLGLTPRPVN